METTFVVKEPQTDGELKEYYEVRYSILMKPWKQPIGAEKDEREAKGIHRMIVNNKGKVVAVARLYFNTDKEAQVQYVAVDENYRNLGLANQIMDELEKIANTRGAEEVMLNSREGAIPFYLKRGYKIIKESYLLFGEIPHKEMRKSFKEKEKPSP